MKNAGIVSLLVCCAVVLELSGAAMKAPGHTSLALKASTTVGKVHLELRKATYGPVRVSVGYSDGHGTEFADAVSLTLGSSSEVV